MLSNKAQLSNEKEKTKHSPNISTVLNLALVSGTSTKRHSLHPVIHEAILLLC